MERIIKIEATKICSKTSSIHLKDKKNLRRKFIISDL